MSKLNWRNGFLLWLVPLIAVGIITGFLFGATDLGETLTLVELIGLSAGIGTVVGLVGYFFQKARSRNPRE